MCDLEGLAACGQRFYLLPSRPAAECVTLTGLATGQGAYAPVAQTDRAPLSLIGGHGFESRPAHSWSLPASTIVAPWPSLSRQTRYAGTHGLIDPAHGIKDPAIRSYPHTPPPRGRLPLRGTSRATARLAAHNPDGRRGSGWTPLRCLGYGPWGMWITALSVR